jgi:signal peptide peptidase SppA
VDELATEIRQARGKKPIVAVANSLMASAAYWICCSADEVVCTPNGQVGSIGVLVLHVDQSAANEIDGLKPTIISAGKYKSELNPHAPLEPEARSYLQSSVDDYYGAFTGAVAAGRHVSRDRVQSGYGQGRVLGARQALSVGLIDRIATLDATIQRLLTPQGRATVGRKAEADEVELVAAGFAELMEADAFTFPTKRQVEHALRDAGLFSQSAAKAFVARGWTAVEERDVSPEPDPEESTPEWDVPEDAATEPAAEVLAVEAMVDLSDLAPEAVTSAGPDLELLSRELALMAAAL